jgi:hypothetical protein
VSGTKPTSLAELIYEDEAMLLFFLFPRYFLNSPVARQEKRFMLKSGLTHGIARTGFFCLVVLIGLFTASPLWHYMGPGTPPELLWMIGVVYAFHVGITFWMLDRSSKAITREISAGRWEDLILTTTDARQIVIGKWCSLTISLLPVCILCGLLKLGVAFGLAQYFNVTEAWHSELYGTALWYISPNFQNFFNPSLLQSFAGLLVLGMYSIVEGGFITALGIIGGLLAAYRSWLGPLIAIGLRGSIVVCTVVLWLEISHQTTMWDQLISDISFNSAVTGIQTPTNVIHDWQRLFEFVQITISPLADSGMVLTSELMRPLDTHFHMLQTFVSAGFGLLLFLMLTWLSLCVAQIMAIRRGALRPVRDHY